MESRFASRKFILGLLLILILSGSSWAGVIIRPEILTALLYVYGIYVTGNVSQKIGDSIADFLNKK